MARGEATRLEGEKVAYIRCVCGAMGSAMRVMLGASMCVLRVRLSHPTATVPRADAVPTTLGGTRSLYH